MVRIEITLLPKALGTFTLLVFAKQNFYIFLNNQEKIISINDQKVNFSCFKIRSLGSGMTTYIGPKCDVVNGKFKTCTTIFESIFSKLPLIPKFLFLLLYEKFQKGNFLRIYYLSIITTESKNVQLMILLTTVIYKIVVLF